MSAEEKPADGKVELTSERRVLSARVGRLRAYLKAAIDASDWSIVADALRALQDEETALIGHAGGAGAESFEARLHNVERAFAAILAGMQPAGQKHPYFDAIAADKPLRFVFAVGRDGKLVVNFVPLEADG